MFEVLVKVYLNICKLYSCCQFHLQTVKGVFLVWTPIRNQLSIESLNLWFFWRSMDQCLLNLIQMGMMRNGYGMVIIQLQTHPLAKRRTKTLPPPHGVLCFSRVISVTDSLCMFFSNVLLCLMAYDAYRFLMASIEVLYIHSCQYLL